MFKFLRLFEVHRQSRENKLRQMWSKIGQINELQKLDKEIKNKGLDKSELLESSPEIP